jgi:hypothetical protein
MIHHLQEQEKVKLFNNLFERLKQGGILLLILLPPQIEYPLFSKALTLYEQTQPHYEKMAQLLQEAGFKVKTDFVEYPLTFSKPDYFKMVENRYISLLSRFNDEELAAGLAEMANNYKNQEVLEFCDRFVFITAQK